MHDRYLVCMFLKELRQCEQKRIEPWPTCETLFSDSTLSASTHYDLNHIEFAWLNSAIRRCVELSDLSCLAIDSDSFIGAALLVRALLETGAIIHVARSDVSPARGEQPIEQKRERFRKYIFATRNPKMIGTPAVNILTQMDKMDRNLGSNIRATYDLLSEISHPNFSGVFGAKMKYSDGRYTSGKDTPELDRGMLESTLALALQTIAFEAEQTIEALNSMLP